MDVAGIAPDQATAIVDIDRTRDFATRELLNPSSLRQEFQRIRDEISNLFKQLIITPHARNAWGAE
jgi:hypothetical protein